MVSIYVQRIPDPLQDVIPSTVLECVWDFPWWSRWN